MAEAIVDPEAVRRADSLFACPPPPAAIDTARWCSCGGELAWVRRIEAREIVSYVKCLFCGALRPMLAFHLDTWEYRVLMDAALFEVKPCP
jgi:hypothetical protein